jgi:hypothetical protein
MTLWIVEFKSKHTPGDWIPQIGFASIMEQPIRELVEKYIAYDGNNGEYRAARYERVEP